MSLAPTSALAAPFLWTPGSPDLTVTISGTDHAVTLPTTWARMLLGHGSTTNASNVEPLPDFLQVLQAALTAVVGAGTWSVTMSPTTGLVTIGYTSTFNLTVNNALLGFTLGALVSGTGATSYTGGICPAHIVLLPSVVGEQSRTQAVTVAVTQAEDGSAYGLSAGVYRATDTLTVDYIPGDTTYQSSQGTCCSPWQGADNTLTTPGSLAVAGRVWSWQDLLAESVGRPLAFARGDYATIATTTGGPTFQLVTLAADSYTAPSVSLVVPSWPAYRRLKLPMTYLGSIGPTTR